MTWHEELPPPMEKDVQRSILDYLALRGIPAIRFNSGAVTATYKGRQRFVRFASEPGVSDVYATLPPHGRACWIEVKRRGKKPTRIQMAFLERQAKAGALCIVAESVDDVMEALP